LKKPITEKRAGGVAQGVGPEFKPQYCQKTKNKQTNKNPRQNWLRSRRFIEYRYILYAWPTYDLVIILHFLPIFTHIRKKKPT
jgi:hypothetical protein